MRNALLLLLLATTAAAQGFDELLPDSTILYVSVENFGRTRERWEKSPLKGLWEDASMQAFLEKPIKAWREWLEESREDEGVALDEVAEVVEGQVVMAFTRFGDDPAALVLADIGENEEQLTEMIRRSERRRMDKADIRREEEDFRGVTIVHYTKEGKTEDAWFLDGKLFAMGADVETLKQLLLRREREEEEGTLAGRAAYRKVRERLGARADLAMYVDAQNLIAALREDGELDDEGMHIMGALGLGTMQGGGLHVSLEDQGVVTRLYIAAPGKKEGVMKLFAAKNAGLTIPAFVPPDADSAGVVRLDLGELWREAKRVADKIQPGMGAQLDGYVEMFKMQTGVDIEADLLGALGGEMSFYMKFPEKAGAGAPGAAPGMPEMALFEAMPGFVIAVQVKDRQRLEQALAALMAQMGPMVEPQEYLGVKMYAFPGVGLPVTPALALLPDRLVFGMRAEDAKEVVGRYGKEEKGLMDREEYARALAGLPRERISLSLQDEAKALRQSMLVNAWTGVTMMTGRGGMDPALFPSVDVLRKYLGLGATVLVNEDDGLSYLYILQLKR